MDQVDKTIKRVSEMEAIMDQLCYAREVNLYLVLNVLALIRIILCLFPQNHWLSRDHETKWGLYRNIPFVIMGVVTVLYLIIWYQEWLLAVLVTVSFVCYMIVVLGARKKPMLGMMMIPKTICYIWMIALFL